MPGRHAPLLARVRARTRRRTAPGSDVARAPGSERERGLRVQAATDAERVRIAGELHDVVAHALGAMTVQAAGARRLVATDPHRAAGAFLAVEQTGREALDELRRLLGVLRRDDENPGIAPQPRLADLAELAARSGAAGLAIHLDLDEAAAAALPRGIDLTAYRVVQEALAEALEHGHARQATVRARRVPGALHVEITDDGHAAPRPFVGMRERLRVYGGELEIDVLPGGGQRVRARLPVEAPR